MWDSISQVLISDNGSIVIKGLLVLAGIACLAIGSGFVRIRTTHVNIGKTPVDVVERTIIRQQKDFAYSFIMSLESKIGSSGKYGGYFMKYVLERTYDEVVDWITLNHINLKPSYINLKQEKICAIVYGHNVSDEFKTPEFKDRMCRWTKELIEKLVRIREVYSPLLKK